jgi:hypothetical protein
MYEESMHVDLVSFSEIGIKMMIISHVSSVSGIKCWLLVKLRKGKLKTSEMHVNLLQAHDISSGFE